MQQGSLRIFSKYAGASRSRFVSADGFLVFQLANSQVEVALRRTELVGFHDCEPGEMAELLQPRPVASVCPAMRD